mmetsp:Transcript_31237/g.50740  ORF Transcript_31237/g.50740 Transcript_31237/m.50740 type:complete len:133 (+) Transcript_31237:251-649(+)
MRKNAKAIDHIEKIWNTALKSLKFMKHIAEYFRMNPEIVVLLLKRLKNPRIALSHGRILMEAVKHKTVLFFILNSSLVWRIFEIIQNKGTVYTTQQQLFEIFRVMLTRESTGNKKVVARFLKKKYTQVQSKI